MREYIRVSDNEGNTYLCDRSWGLSADEHIVDTNPELSVEEICELLNSEAENENYHDWVGVFEKLHSILQRYMADDQARKIFIDILESRVLPFQM